MKTQLGCMVILFAIICSLNILLAQEKDTAVGYVIRQETAIQKDGPGPHHGTGKVTEANFFDYIKDFKLSFRKCVLHIGASIGSHRQEVDEIYYFTSGSGTMIINGNKIDVKPGDAVLTRSGSTHECQQTGSDDLVIIVTYEKEKKK